MERKIIIGSKAIASYVGLKPWTVEKLIDEGAMPGFRLGKRYAATTAALDRWIDALTERSLHAARPGQTETEAEVNAT
jgi:excisionase family DNA binding protein